MQVVLKYYDVEQYFSKNVFWITSPTRLLFQKNPSQKT